MARRRIVIVAAAVALGVAGVPSAWADPPADSPAPAGDGSVADPAADGAPPDVAVGVQGDAYADTDPSALTDFRGALDPHGAWLDDPAYGVVWAPNAAEVGSDFTPYVNAGHWAYDTDYTWVSDYEWGWVAFHYGRWVFTQSRAWVWIPGREYAAAWVVWRLGAEDVAYVGWAPMPPAWGWRDGLAVALGFAPWEPFVFCPPADLFAPAVATRVVAGPQAAAIAVRSRPYVRAAPVVAGHPLAQAVMHGPPPASVGIDVSRVTRLSGKEAGVGRAQVFARPSTAQAAGARPAVPHVVRTRPMILPYAGTYNPPRPAARAPRRR